MNNACYTKRRIIALLFLLFGLGPLLGAQTMLEVEYFKPLEAAGGGYLESNFRYLMICSPHKSVFWNILSENMQNADSEEGGRTKINDRSKDNDTWVYKDFKKQSLVQQAKTMQGNCYLVKDELHPMQWEILQETRQIRGLTVRKAKTKHRGRNYTAWFAPSIPLYTGPWKLGGLPGLILESYDDEEEVVFLFKSLRQIPDQVIREPVSMGRKVSFKAFHDICSRETRQYIDFLEAKMQSTSPDAGIKFSIISCKPWESLIRN